MAALPHKVRIKPKVSYEVVYVDRFDDPSQMGECRRTIGKNTYEGSVRQIVIRSDLSDAMKMKTFIHEVLHAIEYEYKLPIEHGLIHQLENPVFRILSLNKWIK